MALALHFSAPRMSQRLRFGLRYAGVAIAAAFVHEIGHALFGWLQGIPILPTPAKEYILQPAVDWHQKIWISLGGVLATALLVWGTVIWYARKQHPPDDAVLAGVLLVPFLYTLRFLLAGRGHDGSEWQEAQSALGANPAGHAVDVLFLCLLLAGITAWIIRSRASLRVASIGKVAGVALLGTVLLVFLQVANNALFDRFFPKVATLNVPTGHLLANRCLFFSRWLLGEFLKFAANAG